MKYGIYVYKDDLTGFMTPFCSINDNTAKRILKNAVQSNELGAAMAEDISLYKMGEYDSDTTEIYNVNLEFLIRAIDYKEKK